MSMIRREERLKLISEFQKSNLTAAEWARQKGFKADKFYRLLQTERNYVKRINNGSNLSLIPVIVAEEVQECQDILEITAGIFQIKVSENTNWNLLKKTFLCLKSIC